MGQKITKSLCCGNESREEQFDCMNRQIGENKAFSSGIYKNTTDHYSSIDDSLAQRSTHAKNSPQGTQLYPLFFDFDKGFLRLQSVKEPLPVGAMACDESLVDCINDFFEERSFESPITTSSTISSIDQKSASFVLQPAHLHTHFERCYVNSNSPSNLTIYLKREQNDQIKYHSSVSESILENVTSIDSFLIASNLKLYHEAVEDSIESQKILYQQLVKEGLQIQIIYVVFKKMHYQKQRDLIYAKVIQKLDENSYIIAANSVSLQTAQCLLADGAEADSQTKESLAASIASKRSIRLSRPPAPRKMSNDNSEKYERAELRLSGQKITFDPSRNCVKLQELSCLDMKVDAQHYIQKELLIFSHKHMFAALNKEIAEVQQKQAKDSSNKVKYE